MATFADQHWVGAAMLQPRFTYAQRISTQRGAFVRGSRYDPGKRTLPAHALL